jgi:hypothetical protein
LISLITGCNKRIPDAGKIFHAKFLGGNQKIIHAHRRQAGATSKLESHAGEGSAAERR